MKRHLGAITCLILACCNSEKSTEKKVHDDSNGVDLIIEHREGPALSQTEDKLYLVEDGKRKTIFEGYGGSSLFLPPLRRGVLVIAYCGGAIRSAESFLAKENSAGEVTAVKIQPVVASGIQISGDSVCKG